MPMAGGETPGAHRRRRRLVDHVDRGSDSSMRLRACGTPNIGHGHERMARAAYDQMRKLETYHTFGRFANEPALRLADRLVALGPIPGAKVMLTSGGSDSVDLACKLARRHWQLEGPRTEANHSEPPPRLPRAARLRHQHRR
jgi:glutamate/tyrosine decarboxylase-like PLP-dependent enzyme